MVTSINFAPPCIKSPVRSRVSRQNVGGPRDAKFIAARDYGSFTDESIDLVFPGEPVEVARYFDIVWGESRGGTLPMTFQRPDGRGPIEVYFAGRPTITQTNHRTCTIQVSLERRII